MKITYNKNPLCTTVELDDFEKKEMWYKIKLKEMEDLTYTAYHTLTNHKWWNEVISKNGKDKPMRTLEDTVAEAVKELEPEYWLDEDGDKKSKMEERVDMLLEHYLGELVGFHCGDCTCFPASCSKCHAESILGIDTIPGVGKHSLYKIDGAFGKNNERTLDEAIEYLRTYDPTPFTDGGNPNWTQAHHDYHLPRWKAEGQAAYEWLVNYRNTHFKEQS